MLYPLHFKPATTAELLNNVHMYSPLGINQGSVWITLVHYSFICLLFEVVRFKR